MKTPHSQRRSRGVDEKQARRTRSKETRKIKRTAVRKPMLDGGREGEAQLAFQAQLLANVSDAVLATDDQHRITYWNTAAERLFGYTAAEVLGRPAHEVLRSEATPAQRAAYVRELEMNGFVHVESVQYDREGNPLLIHATTTALRASDGCLLGYVAVNHDVTAQRRDEQQLRQQAELLDLTHDAVFVRDLDSRITFWNCGAEAMYGWTRAEAVGQPIQALLRTQFVQPLADIEAQVKQNDRWEGELLHTTRAGRPIQVASRWSLQRDAQGQPIAILEINTDITERKRGEVEIRRLNAQLEQRVAERTAELERTNEKLKQEIAERQRIEDELREAERQANDLIQYAPTAIYEIDLEGAQFTRVNDAMCRMCGYTREELLAMGPSDLLNEGSQRLFQERITKTRAGQAVDETVEYTFKTKDGRQMNALLKTRFLYEEGKPIGASVIAHDITERKRAEEALRKSEARFRLMADSSPFIIWVTDANGIIEFVNQAYCDFFGVTLAQLQSPDGWQLLMHPEDVERYADAYLTALREHRPFLAEARVRRADGEWRWVASTSNPRFSQSGEFLGHVGSSPDITERKQAEEQIKALNRNLERHATELELANRELESFSYSVSHDLRTPLATVDGLSQLLQEDYGASLPKQAQRYLELVRTGTQHMDELIQSLLGLSRLSRHPLKKQRVNMTALVREALETLLQEANRPDLTIEVKDMPEAEADPVLLKQVWVNLIGNACKFTRKRDDARIETGCEPCDGEERVYYVRDNGVGFDMEQVDRLFGVFQRLHNEEDYEGTGVGLAIVARIIHRHGGRVWAEGQVGQGATFYFTVSPA